MPATSFLRQCLYTALAFGAAVALINTIVDPYLLFNRPRTTEFNARKPAVFDNEHLIKAYDVLRFKPKTLLLGTSSMAMGVDALSDAWPFSARPVYNLGMPGEGAFGIRRYLQHVLATEHPQTVVLGLAFRDFFTLFQPKHEPPFESRLAVTDSGVPTPYLLRQRVDDIAYATLSLDTLLESFDTLRGNLGGDSSDIVSGNVDPYWHRSKAHMDGAYSLVVLTDFGYVQLYRDTTFEDKVWTDVRQIFDLCREHEINLTVILEPAHVDELEVIDMVGKWNLVEQWKREFTKLASEYGDHEGRPRVELWDFFGYDAYSTESVPNTKTMLRWFLSPSHYTHALGDLMVRRISGSGDPSFGVKLTPDTIDARLAEVRRERTVYRSGEKRDVERVRKLYAEVY